MGSTEQKTLQSILQAIIDQGNATVTQVNSQVATGTGNLEVVKDLKLQELVGATANHTITLEAKAQELIQLISEQGLRIRINQPAHGFLFNPVQFDTVLNKYVKATVTTGADAMAIRVTDDFFDLVSSGSYVIPQSAVDSQGNAFEIDEYYFLDSTGEGKIARTEPLRYFQPLFLVYSDRGIKTASINVNPMVDKMAQIIMPDGLNGFQLEEDMRLHTEAKSVVGGINELKSRADGLELEVGGINEMKNRVDGLELEVGQNKSDILLKRDKTDKNFGNDLELETLGHITRIAKGILEKDKQELYRYLPQEDKRYKIFDEGSCPISKVENGWARFANGMIIQWGKTGSAPASAGTGTYYWDVTLPVSFSATNSFKVMTEAFTFGSETNNLHLNQTKLTCTGLSASASSFRVGSTCLGTANFNVGSAVRWIAIGY